MIHSNKIYFLDLDCDFYSFDLSIKRLILSLKSKKKFLAILRIINFVVLMRKKSLSAHF